MLNFPAIYTLVWITSDILMVKVVAESAQIQSVGEKNKESLIVNRIKEFRSSSILHMGTCVSDLPRILSLG